MCITERINRNCSAVNTVNIRSCQNIIWGPIWDHTNNKQLFKTVFDMQFGLYNSTVVQWCSGAVVQWCSGAVVQWCSGYSFELPTTRTQVQLECYRVKPWARVFILYCPSSLSCMKESQATDSGGYLCHALIATWLDESQISWDGVWLNRPTSE